MAPPEGPPVLPVAGTEAITQAAAAMQAGGIVGIPTETVYGLGVVPRPEALQALAVASQRPEGPGLALLLDGLDQVDGLVALPAAAQRLAARYWPGPLTLALPLLRPELVPEALSAGRATLAVRIPDHPVPRALARHLGPIAVTAADPGAPAPARTATELVAVAGASLALVLDAGPVRVGVPSTVVQVDADDRCTVLRDGALEAADVLAVAGPA